MKWYEKDLLSEQKSKDINLLCIGHTLQVNKHPQKKKKFKGYKCYLIDNYPHLQ